MKFAHISHHLSATPPDLMASTALRFLGIPRRTKSTPSEALGRKPCSHHKLRRLATTSDKKRGPNPALFIYSLFLMTCTFLLIVAGGLVTSHEAGLAVPDWPLSYGQWMPPMVGNVFWEHGHRMIAATVGLLTVILAVWIHLKDPRSWVRLLSRIAVLAVMFQGLLGGLTVIYLLPAPISVMHACLAQAFFALTVCLAYVLSPVFQVVGWQRDENMAKMRRLLILTASFVFLQLILGACVRHTGSGIVLHIFGAFLVIIHASLVVSRAVRFHSDLSVFSRAAISLGVLVVVQFFIGMGAFIFTTMIERSYRPPTGEVLMTVAHQSTGAVILALVTLLTLLAYSIKSDDRVQSEVQEPVLEAGAR